MFTWLTFTKNITYEFRPVVWLMHNKKRWNSKRFRTGPRLSQEPDVPPRNFIFPSAISRRAVVSYWRQYVHLALVSRLESLSQTRNNEARLTDRLYKGVAG